jgi:hypothetical protein
MVDVVVDVVDAVDAVDVVVSVGVDSMTGAEAGE